MPAKKAPHEVGWDIQEDVHTYLAVETAKHSKQSV